MTDKASSPAARPTGSRRSAEAGNPAATEKTLRRILIVVLIFCVVLTAAHFAYDVYAYRHCSIIYFIAKEIWSHGV